MNKKNYPVVHIGSSSMLVIFIILCLTTFGLLSLSGANRDYQNMQKIADRTASWYQASNQAERKLAEIEKLVDSSSDEKSLQQSLKQIDVSFISSDTVTYSVTIDDSRSLLVELELPSLTVTCWRAVSDEEWNGDTTLNLMQ